MGTCFDLADDVTAINKSWVCILRSAVDGTYNQTSITNDEDEICLFLYEQQFNRSGWYCGYIEAALMLTVGILGFPANCAAVRNFSKRGVSREFMLLISVLAFDHLIISMIAILRGFGRIYPDWPLGQFGCMVSMGLGTYCLTVSVLIMTLISFERRLCVSRATNSQQSSRFFYTVIAVIAVVLFPAVLWYYPLVYMKTLYVYPTYIAGVKNGTEPVDTCLFLWFKFSWSSTINVLFAAITFIIPVGIITINSVYIWQFIKSVHRSSLASKGSESLLSTDDYLGTSHSTKRRRNSQRQSRREAFLSALMVGSIVEFFFCMMPLPLAAAFAMYEASMKTYRAQSTSAFYGLFLIILDSTINPFWSSVIRYKPHRKSTIRSSPDSICAGNGQLEKELSDREPSSSLPMTVVVGKSLSSRNPCDAM